MKQKQFLSLLLCGALLSGLVTGCEKTPEKPIVHEKDTQSPDKYKEASSAPESSSNALSERLQVPEKYVASQTDNDGRFELICNADVFVPEVSQVPIYKVEQKPLNEEWISRVTKAFFGDAPVYDGDKYFQSTKAEARERLNELKVWQSQGNLDPYGIIASAKEQGLENPEEYYSLQEDISLQEQIYNEASETIERNEITPGFGIQPQHDNSDGDYFTGAVELDGDTYKYLLESTSERPMDIRIYRVDHKHPAVPNWISFIYDETEDPGKENPSIPPKEKAEEMAGITPEEAIKTADLYMEKLGLQNFSAKNTSLSLCDAGYEGFAGSITVYANAGYLVSYTRDIDGFPITDEWNPGSGTESLESTIKPWSYEKIEFYINQDGLQQAEIRNLYNIEEKQIRNTELLAFPEIADIFEEIAYIRYSDFTESGSIRLDITDVTLGYTRIYEPSADSSRGLLVPVWDFFGKAHVHHANREESADYTFGGPRQSLLTINGADKTVIDRGLGY